MKKKNILFLAIGAAIATTAAFLLIRKNKAQSQKPPRKAPQLPLSNPGEQSEFITSASESEVG